VLYKAPEKPVERWERNLSHHTTPSLVGVLEAFYRVGLPSAVKRLQNMKTLYTPGGQIMAVNGSLAYVPKTRLLGPACIAHTSFAPQYVDAPPSPQ